MRVLPSLACSFALFLSATAFAHDEATPAAPSPWKGTNVSVGGNATTGNTTAQNLNSAFNLSYAPNQWTFTSENTFNFARTRGKGVTASKLYLMGQMQYAVTERNYFFQQLNYTDDRFDGYRYVANFLVGYGRVIFKKHNMSMSGQIGPGIQRSVEDDTSGGKSTDLLGWNGTLGYIWNFNKTNSFTTKFNVNASSQNVRYTSTTSLTAALMDHFALQLSFQAIRDSKPLGSKKATNTTTTISLLYTFA